MVFLSGGCTCCAALLFGLPCSVCSSCWPPALHSQCSQVKVSIANPGCKGACTQLRAKLVLSLHWKIFIVSDNPDYPTVCQRFKRVSNLAAIKAQAFRAPGACQALG